MIEKTLALSASLLAISLSAPASMVTNSIGNTSPANLTDGADAAVLDIQAAQTSGPSPAPFDASCGNDLLSSIGPCDTSWTHSFGALVDTILSATITIGIAGLQTELDGDQVADFKVDGTDLTSNFNNVSEAASSGSDEYNVFSFSLPSAVFTNLTDGSATVDFESGGQTCTGEISATCNGVFLLFSTLEIELEDAPNGDNGAAPEPATLGLLGLGLAGLGCVHRRRRVGAGL